MAAVIRREKMITVVIPAYNSAGSVRAAVESALGCPTVADVVVVDDGSSDNTRQVVASISDHRLRVFSCVHRGAAAARNFGALRATGDYLVFLDADDELLPDGLDELAQLAKAASPNTIVFGDRVDTYPNQTRTVTSRVAPDTYEELVLWLLAAPIRTTAPLHPRALFLDTRFDESLPFGQETDLHLRLGLAGYVFQAGGVVTFRYNRSNDPSRISNASRTVDEFRHVFLRRHRLLCGFPNRAAIVRNARSLWEIQRYFWIRQDEYSATQVERAALEMASKREIASSYSWWFRCLMLVFGFRFAAKVRDVLKPARRFVTFEGSAR